MVSPAAIARAARSAWLVSIEAHRRSWPEWATLAQRVRERTFELHTIGPRVFVFAKGSRDAPPLSRQVSSNGRVPEVTAPFPAWVSALIGVDFANAGDLASAGTLAGDLWPPTDPGALSSLEDWEHGCGLGPEHRAVARRTFVLQRSRSGTPLFADGKTVSAWDWQTRTFARVATLNQFLRFCLRCALEGSDWWTGWTSGAGAHDGLRPPP